MTSELSLLVVGNGPYANRGCEAIAKSSFRLIRKHFPTIQIVNANEQAAIDQVDEREPAVIHVPYKLASFGRSRLWFSEVLFRKTGLVRDFTTAGKLVREYASKSRAVLSMGGDLYGLSHGAQCLLQYIFLGEAAMAARRPFIIWGATIGSFEEEPRLKKLAIEHFKRSKLILVRDEHSLEYLKTLGVCENVRLVADPAFLLDPVEPQIILPVREPLEETIGFNLAASYGLIGGLGNFRDMVKLGADCVQELMQYTGRPVVMVPHVVAFPPEACPDNDTVFHALIREALLERGLDVPVLPSSLRSWEIKWVLGRLKAYVGSRWHSTVGSMGCGTPTVSIGFSEKTPALNSLLLGHTKFCMHCKNLTVQTLVELVESLLEEEATIRDILRKRVPEICEMANSAGLYLKEALKE